MAGVTAEFQCPGRRLRQSHSPHHFSTCCLEGTSSGDSGTLPLTWHLREGPLKRQLIFFVGEGEYAYLSKRANATTDAPCAQQTDVVRSRHPAVYGEFWEAWRTHFVSHKGGPCFSHVNSPAQGPEPKTVSTGTQCLVLRRGLETP